MKKDIIIPLVILAVYITYLTTSIYCAIGETRSEFTVTWDFPIIITAITLVPAILGYWVGIAKEDDD